MYNVRDVEPMGARLVLLPIQVEEMSRQGLILANVSDEPPTMAEIVAVGLDARGRFEEGDVVIYGKFQGTPVTIAGDHVIILHADDVMLRITNRREVASPLPLPVEATDDAA